MSEITKKNIKEHIRDARSYLHDAQEMIETNSDAAFGRDIYNALEQAQHSATQAKKLSNKRYSLFDYQANL